MNVHWIIDQFWVFDFSFILFFFFLPFFPAVYWIWKPNSEEITCLNKVSNTQWFIMCNNKWEIQIHVISNTIWVCPSIRFLDTFFSFVIHILYVIGLGLFSDQLKIGVLCVITVILRYFYDDHIFNPIIYWLILNFIGLEWVF